MTTLTISDNDYRAMQDDIEIMACALLVIDPEKLTAFIERADRAQALGPILHPSEFRTGSVALSQVIAHARVVQKARTSIVETLP